MNGGGKKVKFSGIEKELIRLAEQGNHENMENFFEENHNISKEAINHSLYSLCKHYKTHGQYQDCLNLLLKYPLLPILTPRKKADVNFRNSDISSLKYLISRRDTPYGLRVERLH